MSAQKGYILPLVLFGSVALLSGIGLLIYFWTRPVQQTSLTPLPTPIMTPSSAFDVTDFESCVKAGNPVMESYPRQCSANGRSFTEVTNDSVTLVSEWSSYINNRYKFTLDYPKGWYLDGSDAGKQQGETVDIESVVFISPFPLSQTMGSDEEFILLRVFENPERLSASDAALQIFPDYSVKKINLGGYDAVVSEAENDSKNRRIIVVKDDMELLIDISKTKRLNSQIYERILQSFRFF